MALKLIPGKVYIRNPKNGRVYEYEKNLATMEGFEQFTAEEAKPKKAPPKPATTPTTPPKPATTPTTPPAPDGA